jgi:hypothetical protein
MALMYSARGATIPSHIKLALILQRFGARDFMFVEGISLSAALIEHGSPNSPPPSNLLLTLCLELDIVKLTILPPSIEGRSV